MIEKHKDHIRSDSLAGLHALFAANGPLRAFGGPIWQVELILDANVVLYDVIWMAAVRRKDEARSTLMELMISETVRALAPDFLKTEMRKHLRHYAIQKGFPYRKLLTTWREYQRYITFMPVKISEQDSSGVRDPKDLPYLELQKESGALIYSNDKDIPAMGGRIIDVQIVPIIRDYARNAAIEYNFKFAGGMSVILSAGVIKSVAALVGGMAKKFSGPLLLTGAVFCIALVFDKKLRSTVLEKVSSWPQGVAEAIQTLYSAVEPMVLEHSEKKIASVQLKNEIERNLCGETSKCTLEEG